MLIILLKLLKRGTRLIIEGKLFHKNDSEDYTICTCHKNILNLLKCFFHLNNVFGTTGLSYDRISWCISSYGSKSNFFNSWGHPAPILKPVL